MSNTEEKVVAPDALRFADHPVSGGRPFREHEKGVFNDLPGADEGV
jgi:hypothetical protein